MSTAAVSSHSVTTFLPSMHTLSFYSRIDRASAVPSDVFNVTIIVHDIAAIAPSGACV